MYTTHLTGDELARLQARYDVVRLYSDHERSLPGNKGYRSEHWDTLASRELAESRADELRAKFPTRQFAVQRSTIHDRLVSAESQA